jgi:hypothetical protein
MGAKMDRVIASLQRKLARESNDAFHRGMHFPTRWDPFFKDYMPLEGVYRYPGKHFDFHKRQLILNSAADRQPLTRDNSSELTTADVFRPKSASLVTSALDNERTNPRAGPSVGGASALSRAWGWAHHVELPHVR